MDRESSLCITNANINFPSDELLLNQSIKQLEKIIPSLEILTLSTLNITFMYAFKKGYKVVGGGCVYYVYGCCSSSHLSLLQEWFLQRCTYANYSSTNKGSLHKMEGNMKADTVQYFKNSNSEMLKEFEAPSILKWIRGYVNINRECN